jgi:hypothetical protein
MLQPAPQLRSIVDPDGAVILNNSRSQITTLDAMGGYIWRQLEQGVSTEGIVRDVIDQTAAPRQVVEDDVRRFLDDLISRGLLMTSASPSEAR